MYKRQRRASGLAARCDKLSGEIDILSERLLKVEARGAAAATPEAAPPGEAGVEELSVEIGLLSGIVRDLAAVVSAQDGEIAGLKDAQARAQAEAGERAQAQAQSHAALHAAVQAELRARPAAVPPPVPAAPRAAAPPPPPSETPAPRPLPPIGRRPAPVEPAERPDARARERAIVEAFDRDGVSVYLQPIVTLPQRKVVAYEASARLRLGEAVLAPAEFLPVLERHGRSTDLDRRMLQRVAVIGRHLAGRGSEAAVSYALSPLSLFEPGFLRDLARDPADPALAGRLVLALSQACWRGLDREQAAALAALRERFGFGLDRASDLRFDAAALAARGVVQVKAPAELLVRAASGGRDLTDIAVEDLVALVARAGLRLVAEGVEREADVPDLLDLDVPFAQGPVFAEPRAVRADVLGAPPAAPEPEETGPPPPRRGFRDFLRRAG